MKTKKAGQQNGNSKDDPTTPRKRKGWTPERRRKMEALKRQRSAEKKAPVHGASPQAIKEASPQTTDDNGEKKTSLPISDLELLGFASVLRAIKNTHQGLERKLQDLLKQNGIYEEVQNILGRQEALEQAKKHLSLYRSRDDPESIPEETETAS